MFDRVNCDDLVGSTKGQESVAELRRQRSMLDQEELDLERRRVRIDAHLSDRGHPHIFDAKPSPAESNLVGLFKELLCEMHSNSLPKLEIEPFSGEPEQFYTFLCSFRQEVEAKVADPHKRLSYLLHYCRGPAKDAIRHCVLLPSATCFATAMDILRSQFGRPSQIIQAVTENMFTGPPIRHDDVEGLQRLLRQMRSGSITLSQLGRIADLDCTVNILRIVRRLPKVLQNKWAEVAESLTSVDR